MEYKSKWNGEFSCNQLYKMIKRTRSFAYQQLPSLVNIPLLLTTAAKLGNIF